MARINFEEKWSNDPRREALGSLLGNIHLTESVAYKLWRLSQTYWAKGLLIPGHVFIHMYGAKAVLDSGLARVYGMPKIWVYPDACEQYPNAPQRDSNEVERELNETRTRWASVRELSCLEPFYIYANGTREHHFWLVRSYLQRVEAGKKSAEARRMRLGTAQPHKTCTNETPTKTPPVREIPERDPNETRTSSNGPEHSSSISSSVSTSNKGKKKNTYTGSRMDYPPEFEIFWDLYEGKGEKRESFENWKAISFTPEEKTNLVKAIGNYKKAKTVKQYRKDFERFLKMDWRPWINPTPEFLQQELGQGTYPNGKVQKSLSIDDHNQQVAAAFMERQKKGTLNHPTDKSEGF